MEIELEARVKALGYKVKATSRESPSQKASHVLDADLRTHWSTATNTKEWILLELNVRFLTTPLIIPDFPINLTLAIPRNPVCFRISGFTTSPSSNGKFLLAYVSRS